LAVSAQLSARHFNGLHNGQRRRAGRHGRALDARQNAMFGSGRELVQTICGSDLIFSQIEAIIYI
jgi:hypothetical protein